MRKFSLIVLLLACFQLLSAKTQNDSVKIWQESLTLPTYLLGTSEKAPFFSREFAYQRAKRAIYPYALQDNIGNKKEDHQYTALYLENKYIKLCVLPEIGGRLFYAIDKTNNYDIFYHQSVIKPSNVGMLGAWISGGVEFNAFHHHRASSSLPVDFTLVENTDGSKTIWIGETEPRQRMKWIIGLTLYPGKSYIEVTGRMMNPTANSNSFLYWSNVATQVNKDYQVIFPPRTDFGVYHAKNSFCHWPQTMESYVGKNYYKDGVDASWWKNHPDPVSIFAYDLKEGFIAGYDHGKNAGTMLVGDPNIIKGGKLWQWGPGAYGAMWDTKVLTDHNGPYAELMVSAYSDNQPDYSWLKPYEIKSFNQYWYGIRELKGAKAANIRASLNFELKSDNQAFIAVNTTEEIKNASINVIAASGKVMYQKTINIAPDAPYKNDIKILKSIADSVGFKIILLDERNNEIIAYHQSAKGKNLALPEVVQPPLLPEKIKSIEELYLTGLRIKQFHHPFLNPLIYFDEALKRDPFETRCNTQLGIHYREQGEYDKAASYFRKAINRLTKNYTRPRDCEALYNLGLILQIQGKFNAAIDTLSRAAWDYDFASPSFYRLAQISMKRNDYYKALKELDQSLTTNISNLNSLNLKASLLRKTGDFTAAEAIASQVLAKDPLNFYALNEKHLILLEKGLVSAVKLNYLKAKMRDMPESYLELAVAYMNNGLFHEAEEILERALSSSDKGLNSYPTIAYYMGYLSHLKGDKNKAKDFFHKASLMPIDYCFPFRMETQKVYETALTYFPEQSNTWYYLGNLLFEKQPSKAIECWEKSVLHNPSFAMAYRNLGWGYNYHEKNLGKAITAYEKAIECDNSQAIYLTELDELYESNKTPVNIRHEMLTKNHQTVLKRNDTFIREIRMLIQVKQFDQAIEYLTSNFFSRQEGVDDLHNIYVDACLLYGERWLEEGNTSEAVKYFRKADEYPENQYYPREENYPRNGQIYYLTGLSLEKVGKKSEAMRYYNLVSNINTQGTVYEYYSALSRKKINNKENVEPVFDLLINSGKNEITTQIDNYFVSFGPGKSLQQVNSDGYYKTALGYLGKGNLTQAKENLENAINTKPDHLWAKYYLSTLKHQ